MIKRRANYFISKNDASPSPPQQGNNNNYLPYAHKWRMGTLNCRGLNEQSKREQIMEIMRQLKIDVLALQETKVNHCSEECRVKEGSNDQYRFFFSSANDTQRHIAQAPQAKAKAKCAQRTEHCGVGFVIGPRCIDIIADCVPHNGRLIELHLHNKGPDICILNHYAPHSAKPSGEKDTHWGLLTQITQARSCCMPTFVVGDANARLHGRAHEIEETVVGPHVFGWGQGFVTRLPEEQLENRQLMIDFCIANDFIISNTFFNKANEHKCTFKDARTDGFKAPWTPDRFAQLDFILAPQRWKNAVLDVHSYTNIAFNSDHAVVVADMRLKLRKHKSRGKAAQNAKRFFQPTDAQLQRYNQQVHSQFIFKTGTLDEKLSNCCRFVSQLHKAALEIFDEKHVVQNRDYLSRYTWHLINQRQIARQRRDTQAEQVLNREIKKSAKRDKIQWRINKLEDLTDIKNSWKHIKYEKRDYMPKFYDIKDIRGNRVPLSKKADAIAEYLFEKQWGPTNPSPPPENARENVFSHPLPFFTGNLSANEVRNAISKLKTNKTPGPDGAITELFKWLDDHTLEQLTDCLNVFWTEKQVPDSFTQAQVCCIYKKGAHDNPENFRPISLLNTSYKIFASIIQSRLANILESLLGDTQYGFRPKRSTAEPLFCVRRLADFAEQGNDPLF